MEAGSILVVAGGESAELFEAGEAAFNPVAFLVELFVVLALLLAVGFRRDRRLGSGVLDMFYDGIGVVALSASTASALRSPNNAMA